MSSKKWPVVATRRPAWRMASGVTQKLKSASSQHTHAVTKRGRQRDPIVAWCCDFQASQSLLSQPSRSCCVGRNDLLRPDVVDFQGVHALWASRVDLVATLSRRLTRAVKMFKGLPSIASSSRELGSMTEVVTGSSSSNPCPSKDEAAGMRQVSTPLENCEE